MGELLIWTESGSIKELRLPLSADPQYADALQLNLYFSICSYVLTTFDPWKVIQNPWKLSITETLNYSAAVTCHVKKLVWSIYIVFLVPIYM